MKQFQVNHYHIVSSKFGEQGCPMNIALLSDLHNKEYGSNNQTLIQELVEQKPDLILIAGDMLVGKRKISNQSALELVKRLVEIAPVIYGNGNHEQRMREDELVYGNTYKEYKQTLEDAGVVFLENKSLNQICNQRELKITGLEIPLEYFKKFQKKELQVDEIKERIGECDKSKYNILIAHNPVHASSYETWGADLVVSGHLHGGMIRLPFLGGIITPQVQILPRYSGGAYLVNGMNLIVSRGLGEHTVKVRINNKPELVMIHLDGAKRENVI